MTYSNITDIVFLGAGASKSDGAPIQSELFGDYFSKFKKKKQNATLSQVFQ